MLSVKQPASLPVAERPRGIADVKMDRKRAAGLAFGRKQGRKVRWSSAPAAVQAKSEQPGSQAAPRSTSGTMKPPASLNVLERPRANRRCRRIGGRGRRWLVFGLGAPRRARPASMVSKSSCAGVRRAGYSQGTAPSALPGSTATFGCFSHQPDALNARPQRGRPANTGRGGAPKAHHQRIWPAVLTLKRAALRADDAVASHRAADGAGPPIEGARTCAHGTTTGAVHCVMTSLV